MNVPLQPVEIVQRPKPISETRMSVSGNVRNFMRLSYGTLRARARAVRAGGAGSKSPAMKDAALNKGKSIAIPFRKT